VKFLDRKKLALKGKTVEEDILERESDPAVVFAVAELLYRSFLIGHTCLGDPLRIIITKK
jgi:hypothetical protein